MGLHLVNYQREVNEGKLTTVANWEKLTSSEHYFAATKVDEKLTLESSAFLKQLRRLIYPYQLHVDN